MFVVFFLLWIIFNGRVTTEIVLFGLAVSAALYWFICKFMEFGPRKEWALSLIHISEPTRPEP